MCILLPLRECVLYIVINEFFYFSTTTEQLEKHFLTKVSEVTSVRIPKRENSDASRGFAYVELANSTDYEVCQHIAVYIAILNIKIICACLPTYDCIYLFTESTFVKSLIPQRAKDKRAIFHQR